MSTIPTNIRAKDLQVITGKSHVQSKRDLSAIKKVNGKQGRKVIVTISETADFYKITENQIKELLTIKPH